ncbi:MAG TPA: TetR/AcrR family transcriptional regulator [Mycobacteriales bacterium]|nr:TetR/AcrR family transcriptional regulator [Mycobacteriales bacterium]
MSSQRHTSPTPVPAPRSDRRDRTQDAVLAAAKECVLDVGLRRTTLADVARRAGVSRMTVYRRYGDFGALVSELLTTELLTLVDAAREEVADLPTARERLVEAGVRVVERLTEHPLWCRVLDLDPELLLPLVVDRFGSTQRAVVDHVAAQVVEGQQDGSVRPVDARLAATCLLLTAQSFVFSARIVQAQHPADATLGELRRLLDAYLRPDR